ncbi:YitT family protein [Fusobacterium sp. PH5-44]|uniref:YitT family protein n=1 Tax=unclassified Fusobacterium TaxID=2648384 RepID=UPI003D1AB54B
MKNNKIFRIIKDGLLIGIGAFIYAFGLNYFFVANKLADGGLAGISIVLHYLFGLDTAILYFILNIPLILLGYKLIGKKFIIKTFYGTIMTSIAIKVFSNLGAESPDKIIVSIFGGVVMGVGLGIVFLGGGSSGGSDILAKIINKYFKIPIGKAFFIIDFIVLGVIGYLFGKEMFMYTIIGIYVSTKMIDIIQDGIYSSKAVTIISDRSLEIKNAIMEETGRGTTVLKSEGGFSGESKDAIYCVLSRYELSAVKSIVKNIDENAFVIISEVTEVIGEGFE